MPQLNPTPWFPTLVFSWVVFLIVVPSKIIAHTFTNEAPYFILKIFKAKAWAWPWQ